MATGFGRTYLLDMEVGRRKGFSPDTAHIIKKAKEFLATFDAKLVVTGKMNFLAYCFRSKNYYGMSDKSEYVISATQRDESPSGTGLLPLSPHPAGCFLLLL